MLLADSPVEWGLPFVILDVNLGSMIQEYFYATYAAVICGTMDRAPLILTRNVHIGPSLDE